MYFLKSQKMYEESNRNKKINLIDTNLHKHFIFDENKKGHILTFSDKMQFCAVSCFPTCDWFCPMTSHIIIIFFLMF